MDPWAVLRECEFRGLGDSIYLDAAALGPLPVRARRAIEVYNEHRSSVHRMRPEDFFGPLSRLREAAARLIGAEPEEIALGGNTTFGIQLATGLRVPTGSTVLVSDREFPANVYPWMGARRLRLELVPTRHPGCPDELHLLERLDRGDVSILAISSVQFSNGFRADLDRLGAACRERGIYFVVDAIQSLGQIPLDLSRTPVDLVATGGHKWLCGPFGTGFAYIRREIQDELELRGFGWGAMEASQDLDSLLEYSWSPLADARRFEGGTPPLQDYLGLAEAIELLLETGVEAIRMRIDALLQPLRRWLLSAPGIELLSEDHPERRSGIVSFRTPDSIRTARALRRAGILCSLREGAIRISAHLYNRPADLERTIEELEALARSGWG